MKNKIKQLRQEGYFSKSELAFLDEIEKIDKISKKETIELVKKAQSGDMDARDKLIKSSLGYVASMSVNFLDKGVDFLDLVQEGTIGLITSIEKCNVSRTEDFRGYAYYYVFSALDKATKTSDIIRKPEYYATTCIKVDNIINLLRHEYHREPTLSEIAKETGIPVENVETILVNSQAVESLDDYIDEETTLKDTIVSEEDYNEEIDNDLLRDELNSVFDKVSAVNPSYKTGVEMLKKHWGFDDDFCLAREAIGQEYNCSDKEVGRMEAKVLKKIRVKYGKNISK